MFIDYFKTPYLLMKIIASDKYLLECSFVSSINSDINQNEITKFTKKYLENYFNNKIIPFPKNLIKFNYQNFNDQVYQLIFKKVTFGSTITYKMISDLIDCKSYKKIIDIINKNKIMIIIPSHRIIKSNNKLNYNSYQNTSSWNCYIKWKLIEHEKIVLFHKKLKEWLYFKKHEINHLKSHPKLKVFFNNYQIISKTMVYNDPFWALLSRVIYQQIANKTAKNLELKLFNYLNGDLSPQKIVNIKNTIYNQMGFSKQKILYIKNVCNFVINNPSLWKKIIKSKDESFIKNHLLNIQGIGSWSVWTFLLFGLKWKNVIKFDDLIVKKALQKIYRKSQIQQKDFINFIKGYENIGSLISINIWNFINP